MKLISKYISKKAVCHYLSELPPSKSYAIGKVLFIIKTLASKKRSFIKNFIHKHPKICKKNKKIFISRDTYTCTLTWSSEVNVSIFSKDKIFEFATFNTPRTSNHKYVLSNTSQKDNVKFDSKTAKRNGSLSIEHIIISKYLLGNEIYKSNYTKCNNFKQLSAEIHLINTGRDHVNNPPKKLVRSYLLEYRKKNLSVYNNTYEQFQQSVIVNFESHHLKNDTNVSLSLINRNEATDLGLPNFPLKNLKSVFDSTLFKNMEHATGEINFLPLANNETQYVKFDVIENTKRRPKPCVSMLCFSKLLSTTPKYVINLSNAKFFGGFYNELGPCFCLVEIGKIYEFQCFVDAFHNYEYWQEKFRYMGVKVLHANDLFKPLSSKLVGEGSFAKVYKAEHKITKQIVCIKRVPKKRIVSDYISAVQIEIDMLKKIKHMYIVQFICAFEDDLNYNIVLEYIPGGTISDWLHHNKRMTEVEAKQAIVRIFHILSVLRLNKIVHRDLKPENLILENHKDPSTIKLIDFGLAAYIGSSRMFMNCGSPGFVAPEIINKSCYGLEVDIFSTGVLLYTFLSGITPFHADGDTASNTLYKNKSCKVSFDHYIWKNVTPNAKDLVIKLLTKDPKDRITIENVFKHPWIDSKDF